VFAAVVRPFRRCRQQSASKIGRARISAWERRREIQDVDRASRAAAGGRRGSELMRGGQETYRGDRYLPETQPVVLPRQLPVRQTA